MNQIEAVIFLILISDQNLPDDHHPNINVDDNDDHDNDDYNHDDDHTLDPCIEALVTSNCTSWTTTGFTLLLFNISTICIPK